MCPMGIGETLHLALWKIVLRSDGDQAKRACASIKIYAGLEADIEGATYAIGQKKDIEQGQDRERRRKEHWNRSR